MRDETGACEREKYRDAGINGWITKPAYVSRLTAIVEERGERKVDSQEPGIPARQDGLTCDQSTAVSA